MVSYVCGSRLRLLDDGVLAVMRVLHALVCFNFLFTHGAENESYLLRCTIGREHYNTTNQSKERNAGHYICLLHSNDNGFCWTIKN